MTTLRAGRVRAAAILAAVAAFLCVVQAGQASAETLVVPAYFYPGSTGGYWNQVDTAARSVPTVAILNPNSGPGTAADPNYLQALDKLHAAGGKVYGYVHTSYGTRPISDVTGDINTYIALYPVDGFFIDEMTSDAGSASLNYYLSIYNYVKGRNAAYGVMGNPGTSVPEIYASLPVADSLVVFESSAKAFASYQPAAWQAGYPAERFVSIVYAASKSQMPGIVQFSAAHGIGNVYVTPDHGGNPYDTLPSYWTAEVSQAAAY